MSLTFSLQALLARHEQYLVEAEEERLRMAASINKLETDKKELQDANAKTIEENRSLLDQLEDLNNVVSDSDAQIMALTNTLLSTRKEIDRLTALAAKTSQLEAQMTAMDTGQKTLQDELATIEADKRSAFHRWRIAERTISNLQEQVDKIEQEAKNERLRHEEVVGRLEKRRTVEKELDNAAGRLKGAAAISSMGQERDGHSNVVSHFVKDILQDNANLQMGIMELREMLQGSNTEVENLREQMMLHQELGDEEKDLRSELTKSTPTDNMPELHVHHHYHAPNKPQTVGRRPKKRRSFTRPGFATPSSGTQTPRSISSEIVPSTPISMAEILAQTSVTIPTPPPPPFNSQQRPQVLSQQIQSSITPSSMASSPRSVYQSNSIFDSIETPVDSSRPTSPESNDPGSPFFNAGHRKWGSGSSFGSIIRADFPQTHPTKGYDQHAGTASSRGNSQTESLAETDLEHLTHSTIPEEPEDDAGHSPDRNDHETAHSHRLHRSTSTDSVLSVSGMDIPILRKKQAYLFPGRTPSSLAFGPCSPTTKPVIDSASATALPSSRPGYSESSTYNRSLLSRAANFSQQPSPTDKAPLGKRVGGWVWGKWGVTPMASTGNLRAKASLNASNGGRATGVNQSGSIRGLMPPQKAPSVVEPHAVDEALLNETLGE